MVALAACHEDIDQLDGPFYDGDHRLVHCGVNLDTSARTSDESIDSGLERAAARGEVVELYAHHPGVTVPIARIEHVLQKAHDLSLGFATYADFAHDTYPAPALALSFDDTFIDDWYALRPLFDQYGAHVTFFIAHWYAFDADQIAKLHQLADDGHDIEAHTINHLRAPDFVENYGLESYLTDEVQPSIDVLRAEGFEVPAFAYPFGARTSELDDAIGKRVTVIRSVDFAYDIVQSPCPR